MTEASGILSRKALMQYGILAMPIAFAGMPLYVHAPDYYATEFGVSLASIGFILLFLRMIDALQDPLIGRLSDRFSQQRPRVILIAAIILVLALAGLFSPLLQSRLLIWFALMVLLASTAFSVLSINLNTSGSLWSRNHHQKTRITGAREAFGLLGLLLAVLLPSIFMQSMPKAEVFSLVSLVLCCVMCVGVICFLRWHRSHAASTMLLDTPRAHSKHSTITQLRNIPRDTWRFFAVYGVSMLASSIPAILVLFFIRDRLGAESETGLFLVLYFLSGAACMPAWNTLSRRWNKHYAWLGSMLLAIISFIWAYFLGEGDIVQYAIICVLSGIAFGADLALPPSILADHIHEYHDEEQAALQFGVFAFLAKSALAIGSLLAFTSLDWAGFRAGESNSSEALFILSFTYAVIPCAIKLIAVALLWRISSNLTGDNHDDKTNNHTTDRSRSHA